MRVQAVLFLLYLIFGAWLGAMTGIPKFQKNEKTSPEKAPGMNY